MIVLSKLSCFSRRIFALGPIHTDNFSIKRYTYSDIGFKLDHFDNIFVNKKWACLASKKSIKHTYSRKIHDFKRCIKIWNFSLCENCLFVDSAFVQKLGNKLLISSKFDKCRLCDFVRSRNTDFRSLSFEKSDSRLNCFLH